MLSSRSVMRAFLVVVLVGGCQLGIAHDKAAMETDGGDAVMPGECVVDTDCVLAGVKCCDCPSFAVPVLDPAQNACDSVVCPAMSCPDNVAARCDEGACTLACKPLACTTTCAGGYAIGPSGCLTCECATAPKGECTSDGDCARVRADCCGCDQGGSDTAIPRGQVADHEAKLGCPSTPSCPGVNTCTPGLEPACVQGACSLVDALPGNACGRPDLPACDHCVVNADDAASAHGVGVCL